VSEPRVTERSGRASSGLQAPSKLHSWTVLLHGNASIGPDHVLALALARRQQEGTPFARRGAACMCFVLYARWVSWELGAGSCRASSMTWKAGVHIFPRSAAPAALPCGWRPSSWSGPSRLSTTSRGQGYLRTSHRRFRGVAPPIAIWIICSPRGKSHIRTRARWARPVAMGSPLMIDARNRGDHRSSGAGTSGQLPTLQS
jgi:hypothetical protein